MEISEKLAYLNETKEQIKSALQTPYNVFRDYPKLISKYVNNQPKSIVEGENISICENAVDLPCNVNVNGNSYQYTTEGYQLIDFSKPTNKGDYITYSFQNDIATIKADGGVYQKVEFDITDKFLNNAGKKLYFNRDNYETTGETSYTIQIEYKDNGTQKFLYNASSYFSIPEDLINVSTATFCIYANNSATSKQGSVILTKPRVTFNVNEPYEPYTAGVSIPNIDNPQDIEVVEGINIIPTDFDNWESGHYNLLGKKEDNPRRMRLKELIPVTPDTTYYFNTFNDDIEFGIREYDNEKNFINSIGKIDNSTTLKTKSDTRYLGVFIFKSDLGSVTLEEYQVMFDNEELKPFACLDSISDKSYLPYGHIGLVQRGKNEYKTYGEGYLSNADGSVAVDATRIASVTDFIPKRNNKVYLVNEKYNSSANNIWAYRLGFYDKNKKWLSNKIIDKTDYSQELDENVAFIKVSIAIELEETQYVSFIDNQYEPYVEPKIIPIDLAGNSLARAGDIADVLNIGVDGSVSIEKKVNKWDWEDTAKISQISNIGNDWYRVMLSEIKEILDRPASAYISNSENGLCTHLKYSQMYSSQKEHTYISNNLAYVFLKGVSIAEDVKTLLNTLKPTWYYSLATPEIIKLPSIEPITLFEGTNVFELVTNIGTTMKVEYIVNVETLQNEITELSNAVIELGGVL